MNTGFTKRIDWEMPLDASCSCTAERTTSLVTGHNLGGMYQKLRTPKAGLILQNPNIVRRIKHIRSHQAM